ncbi:hypothetical protein [Pararhizobium sp.]|uniref:Pam3-gp28 family putative phage holin n=1 Tax=Pararhizobium sp. TaxID=1977563 RepID=UPI003D10E1C0
MNGMLAPFVTILALVLRHGLMLIAGGIFAEGMTDSQMSDVTTQLAGVLITAVGVAWSLWEKKKSGKLSRKPRCARPC